MASAPTTAKPWWRARPVFLRLGVSIALLGYLAGNVEWRQIGRCLAALDWRWWWIALVLYVSSQLVSVVRWSRLAGSLGLGGPLSRFARLYFEGTFFSLCLPTSVGGDVWKAYRLTEGIPGRIKAGCSVLADRAAGLVALLVIGLAAWSQRWWQLDLWRTACLGCALALVALAGTQAALAGLTRLSRGGRWQIVRRLADALSPFSQRPGVWWLAVGLGLIVQGLNVLAVFVLGLALNVHAPLSAYCVAVPLVALATVLPLSINGVGIREAGLALFLAGYGVPDELGVAVGLMWLSVVTSSGLIGGVTYLAGGAWTVDRGQKSVDRGPWTGEAESGTGVRGPGSGERRLGTVDRGPRSPELVEGWTVDRDGEPKCVERPVELGVAGSPVFLSVVVPVYNERENVRPLYAALNGVLRNLARPFEILLVDDGSNDGTSQVLDQLAQSDLAVKVVHFRRNFGQTAAMDAGIHLASGHVIAMLDADLQNDPADLPAMLARLDEGYDLVHGWRTDRHDAWLSRKVPSKIANWIISRVTRFPVHDLGCTLKVMRREIAQDLQLYGEMHRFIPILAHWRGARCCEMPTRHHARQFGKSKYGISRTVRVVLDLITVKYMVQYMTSPMKLFGGAGLAAGLLGGLAGLATIAMKWLGNVDMTGNPLLLLSVLGIMAGMQFFILGMLGELGVRTYYESQGRQPYAIRRLVNFEARPNPLPVERQTPGHYGSHAA